MIETVIIATVIAVAMLITALIVNYVRDSDDEAAWILEDDKLRKQEESAIWQREQGLTSTNL